MSLCAAGANTGGANIAIDTGAWMAMVTISGHTTPFIWNSNFHRIPFNSSPQRRKERKGRQIIRWQTTKVYLGPVFIAGNVVSHLERLLFLFVLLLFLCVLCVFAVRTAVED